MSDDAYWAIDDERSESPATRDEVWDLLMHQSKVNLGLFALLLKMKKGDYEDFEKDIVALIKTNEDLINLRDKLITRQDEDEL